MIQEIKQQFTTLSPEEKYNLLMKIGKEAPSIPEEHKIEDNLVPGCQSIMHLHAEKRDGKIFFMTSSDALISAGLGRLLCIAYSGLTPEEVLTTPADFLEEIGLPGSLTPSRVNGLYQIHLKMKQKALTLVHSN